MPCLEPVHNGLHSGSFSGRFELRPFRREFLLRVPPYKLLRPVKADCKPRTEFLTPHSPTCNRAPGSRKPRTPAKQSTAVPSSTQARTIVQTRPPHTRLDTRDEYARHQSLECGGP